MSTSSVTPPRIYISHGDGDDAFTRRLAQDLRQAGISVEDDPPSAMVGGLVAYSADGVRRGDWVVAVVSPSAITSERMRFELSAAEQLARQGSLRGLVLVIASPCPAGTIPTAWSAFARLDATQDYPGALAALLRMVSTPPHAAVLEMSLPAGGMPLASLAPGQPEAVAPPLGGQYAAPAAPYVQYVAPAPPAAPWIPVAGSEAGHPRSRSGLRTPVALSVAGLVLLVVVMVLGAIYRPAILGRGNPTAPTVGAATATATPSVVAIAGTIREFANPTPGGRPQQITVGPDGALWYTELSADKIARITTSGSISEFAVPTPDGQPDRITVGPDGALWFTEFNGNKIGRITTSGAVSDYAIPTPDSVPVGITTGPDGALWFTEFKGNKIGRITTAGQFTAEIPVPTAGASPEAIAVGPDGALWFTEYFGNKIGRMTTGGQITEEIPIPTPNSQPRGIVIGPDGALWFTEALASKIARITISGGPIAEYALRAGSTPIDIALGPDAALWFTEVDGDRIGRITATGQITEYDIHTVNGSPIGIVTGPDRAVWFTEADGNKIGQIV